MLKDDLAYTSSSMNSKAIFAQPSPSGDLAGKRPSKNDPPKEGIFAALNRDTFDTFLKTRAGGRAGSWAGGSAR